MSSSWLERSSRLALLNTPAQCCQLGFLLASAAVLTIYLAPRASRKLLLDYGARSSMEQPGRPTTVNQGSREKPILIGYHHLIRLTSLARVPHSWFSSFYVIYLGCTIFWVSEYLYYDGGSHAGNDPRLQLMQWLAERQAKTGGPSMTHRQMYITGLLMILQASRRLYECLVLTRPSSSTMWLPHWLMGVSFYVGISIAVWIEGAGTLVESASRPHNSNIQEMLKICLASAAFVFAWSRQYRCHKYLVGLKKYSLPQQGMFQHIVCPHYTCECIIYLSLALLAAPNNQYFNKTLLSATIFVVTNLGVTAQQTRLWYVEQFGATSIEHRWTMLPGLF